MGEGRGESVDILPVGMADQVAEFLKDVMTKMTGMSTDVDGLARMLDGKDDNEENKNFNELFKVMADTANGIVKVTKEAVENSTAKLEEKNENMVKSNAQRRYIGQIRDAASNLSEQAYAECNLGGTDVFRQDEMQAFLDRLNEVFERWIGYKDELCNKAQELSNFAEKNELSDVCSKIADQIDDIFKKLTDATQVAGNHVFTVNDMRTQNTESINKDAEAAMGAMSQEIINLADQIASSFSV